MAVASGVLVICTLGLQASAEWFIGPQREELDAALNFAVNGSYVRALGGR